MLNPAARFVDAYDVTTHSHCAWTNEGGHVTGSGGQHGLTNNSVVCSTGMGLSSFRLWWTETRSNLSWIQPAQEQVETVH